MAIPYPSSPTVGQTFTYGGITYTWNGVAWTYTQTNTPAVVGSVAVTAPITNTGTPTAPVIGINQSALSIAQSQVTNLVSDLAGKANLVGGNSFTGAQIIRTNGTANIGLVVQGTASQSANLQEWRTDTGSTAIRVASNGLLSTSLSPAFAGLQSTSGVGAYFAMNNDTGGIVTYTNGTANKGLVVRGASGQAVNLQEWQNSGGTVLARIAQTGQFLAPSIVGSAFQITSGGIFSNGATSAPANIQAYFLTTSATNAGLVVRGAASQTADLQQWQTSSGSTAVRVAGDGQFVTTQQVTAQGGLDVTGGGNGLRSIAGGTAVVPILSRGASGQSGDLLQIQNSGSTVLARFNSTGQLALNTASNLAQLGVVPASTATVGVVVQGLSGQSADYFQIQNSSGGTVVGVNSFGTFRAVQVQTTSGEFIGGISNSGGYVRLTKQTAAQTNPGTNLGAIYFRDGTLAGTLRFVSITGASGVEETLIDNISSGTAVASARFTGAGGVNTAGSVISSAGFSLSGTVAPILLNGSAGTSGQVLTSGGAGTTPTWTTVGGGGGSFTGGTLTSDLVLAAGSTAVEPLTFQANTSTVGTVSGAMEYDGTVFYQTSNTNPGKALATQNYYYVSNSDYGPDFTVNSTAKSLLGGSTVGLTVAAGTTYEYELITAISHQFVTTASISGDYLIVSTTVSGSPVVSTTHQVDYGSNTTGFTTATTLSTVRPTGNVTFMPAITSGTRYAFLRAKGLIRVTGTGTVKIYPAIQTSGASGSGDNIWNVRSGTIFKLTPVGNGTVTQVGAFA